MAICDPDSSIFLHGYLELTIFEARCLPNMDLPTERVRRCLKVFRLCKHIVAPVAHPEKVKRIRQPPPATTLPPLMTVFLHHGEHRLTSDRLHPSRVSIGGEHDEKTVVAGGGWG
ncbi:hypothetical protein L1987_34107 [Smallanthus sonchifolius]|uniref:Uncharacterized protein n=1 Tax=Smallanthus sonchifolius TaxID=185202 RepID=A0ACB9HTB0_9ASTR|nr:hypothetical protein L1987_34107 [Smallanthus sonchifolius]